MLIVEIVLAAVIVFGVAAVAMGYGGSITHFKPDWPGRRLPEGRTLRADDVAAARFSLAFRGYRMHEVDDALDRLALEIAERDARIEQLTGQPYEAPVHEGDDYPTDYRADYPTDYPADYPAGYPASSGDDGALRRPDGLQRPDAGSEADVHPHADSDPPTAELPPQSYDPPSHDAPSHDAPSYDPRRYQAPSAPTSSENPYANPHENPYDNPYANPYANPEGR